MFLATLGVGAAGDRSTDSAGLACAPSAAPERSAAPFSCLRIDPQTTAFLFPGSILRTEPPEDTVVRLSFSGPKEATVAAPLGGCSASRADRSFEQQSAERGYVVLFPSPWSRLGEATAP